jgi:hypothetical protein
MKTNVLGFLAMSMAWCTVVSAPATADVLKVKPSEVVTLPGNGSETARIALRFDLSGMRQGEGLEIIVAHLDCRLDAMPADRETYYEAFPIADAWTAAEASFGGDPPVVAESAAVKWNFTPADYERIQGGFVRFDLRDVVGSWLDGQLANNGLVISTGDVESDVFVSALRETELVVRYGFVKRE